TVLIVVVVVFLVRYASRTGDHITRCIVGAIVGAAMSNLADRVCRADDGPLSGAVVDFVDLQWWPVFNLADAVIVVSGILLVLRGWTRA
ncbi:MAG: signal peptidase II, partial [Acidimicrobiales bacterium]|nr:signal peptidase II [Acidimicrobiales bacterium]